MISLCRNSGIGKILNETVWELRHLFPSKNVHNMHVGVQSPGNRKPSGFDFFPQIYYIKECDIIFVPIQKDYISPNRIAFADHNMNRRIQQLKKPYTL